MTTHLDLFAAARETLDGQPQGKEVPISIKLTVIAFKSGDEYFWSVNGQGVDASFMSALAALPVSR